MIRKRCFWCGLKFEKLPFVTNEKRQYCSEKCRVASNRNQKKGWQLITVERHEDHLNSFISKLGNNFNKEGIQFDDVSRYFLVRKLEHGDTLSEASPDKFTGCWRIYVNESELSYFLKYRKHPQKRGRNKS